MYQFNVKKLIEDVGGVTAASRHVGKVRGAVYGWLARNRMGTDDLALLKGELPDLDLNSYVSRRK